MKIMIIGSAGYLDEIKAHQASLRADGHDAEIAAYDALKEANEFEVCSYNKDRIKWADEVHVFWDSRSIGTLFDIGMAFALDKPMLAIKLQSKTFRNFVLQYDDASRRWRIGRRTR